jgi:hypothetical protein
MEQRERYEIANYGDTKFEVQDLLLGLSVAICPDEQTAAYIRDLLNKDVEEHIVR